MNKAGVVVLYNPIIDEVLENIASYIDDLDVLYCIDNSINDNNKYFNNIKIRYISQGKNVGLVRALSLGCNLAIENNADILLTLDQDTYFNAGSLRKLLNNVEANKDLVAVPNVKRIIRENGKRIFHDEPMYSTENMNVSWAITSGSVFTSELFKKIGGFDNCLFIGQIDQDFCTAVYKNHYVVKRIGDSYIYQELGSATKHKFINRFVFAPNLTPIRYYYVFRNERYLRRKWGKAYSKNKVALYKYILVVLFFEDNKLIKIKYMFKGYKDGKNLMWRKKDENIC